MAELATRTGVTWDIPAAIATELTWLNDLAIRESPPPKRHRRLRLPRSGRRRKDRRNRMGTRAARRILAVLYTAARQLAVLRREGRQLAQRHTAGRKLAGLRTARRKSALLHSRTARGQGCSRRRGRGASQARKSS